MRVYNAGLGLVSSHHVMARLSSDWWEVGGRERSSFTTSDISQWDYWDPQGDTVGILPTHTPHLTARQLISSALPCNQRRVDPPCKYPIHSRKYSETNQNFNSRALCTRSVEGLCWRGLVILHPATMSSSRQRQGGWEYRRDKTVQTVQTVQASLLTAQDDVDLRPPPLLPGLDRLRLQWPHSVREVQGWPWEELLSRWRGSQVSSVWAQ